MRVFRIPYRWTWRTAWTNITSAVDDVTHGIGNIIRWIPVIWFDADFDWGYLNSILIYKFKRMAKTLEDGPTMSGSRHARQLRICAELCRRMGENVYFDIAAKRYPEQRGKAWGKMINDLKSQDQKLLGKLIGKHYQSWWN